MPESSELFPINKGSGGGSQTVVDDSPPKIVLIDKPETSLENGILSFKIKTLLFDEGVSGVATTATPPPQTKPVVSWVGSASDATTLGGTVNVRLRIDETSPQSPIVSWVNSSSNATTLGGEVNVQLRIG